MLKANEIEKFNELNLKERIFTIRGFQVMLDSELAELYEVETKVLNQAVKRNKQRFPDHYRFQLLENEKNELVTNCDRLSKADKSLRSQFVTLENLRGKHSKYLPYVFTEQGVAMLSAVLRSQVAITISIQIVDAFIEMRKFINSNAQIFQRLDRIEVKQVETNHKFDKVFSALETHEDIPKQRIFFDGQVFDAHKFVSDLFSSVKKSIVIIDNYIDVTIIAYLSQLPKNIKVKIITSTISIKLKLDLEKFANQHFPIEIKIFKKSHDRFVIIDDKDVYHLGASLKDLGKKWFAFSKMDKVALDILNKIEQI
jgi:phage regulator Rha-like protein